MSLSFIKDSIKIFDYFEKEYNHFRLEFSKKGTIEIENGSDYLIFGRYPAISKTRIYLRYSKPHRMLKIIRLTNGNYITEAEIKNSDVRNFKNQDEITLILIHGRSITNSGLFGDDLIPSLEIFDEFKASKLISPIFNKE